MTTRLLTRPVYLASCIGPMQDITGREVQMQPDGVLDLSEYLAAIPARDLGGLSLLGVELVDRVYRTGDGRFDHVLFPCSSSNVYLVVVVDLVADAPFGHFLLDLNVEHGLGT